MFTRREWIETAAAFSAWPALRSPVQPVAQAGAPNDDAFWSDVRARFELLPDAVNLVTVVRGVTTRRTREATMAAAERMNAFHPLAAQGVNWKQDARQKAARIVGAPVDAVALVRNTTEGVATVLHNWPLERGDEILTSSAEHGPFYGILAQRAARDGVLIRRFHYPAPAPSLDAIVEAVDRAMSPRTRLVMIGQVVLTGQITPVRAIADRVHARGATLLVDGVLAVGHVVTDITAMDCDFYAAGFHKWGCGPRATAVFYVRPGLVEQLPPLFAPNGPVMTKYENAGAHPDAQYFALSDGLDFLSEIGMARIQARLFALTARWLPRAQRAPQFRTPGARRLFGEASPIGRRIRSGRDEPWSEIVGVVGDVRQQRLDVPAAPEYYTTFQRMPMPFQSVVVRGRSGTVPVADVRNAVRRLDPGVALANLMPLAEWVRVHTRERQFALWVLATFAALALGLGAVGVYGAVSYTVGQRGRELGIRLALGETPRGLRIQVLKDGMRVVGAGVVVGLLGAMAAAPIMRRLLFGIGPFDPLVYLGVPTLLLLISALACWRPASMAARIAVTDALRSE